ncbi:hypothetical protein Q3G72_026284 [Acer saccharum]|nr:hypothetical protein Q3G72_026284 [Acer saccharum]
MLTRADIERRLTIPRYYVGAFPDVQENQAVELKVKDEMGHAWTFRCSLESAISPRLVFSSGWLHFASSKHLHVGDTIIIHREVDQDNTAAPYKIEANSRLLGFSRENGPEVKEDVNDDKIDDHQPQNHPIFHEIGLPRKGFGVQGLRWYAKCLKIDEDGDVADEFLDEVLTETSVNVEEKHTLLSKFEVRYSTKPVKVKNQVSLDGRIQ